MPVAASRNAVQLVRQEYRAEVDRLADQVRRRSGDALDVDALREKLQEKIARRVVTSFPKAYRVLMVSPSERSAPAMILEDVKYGATWCMTRDVIRALRA